MSFREQPPRKTTPLEESASAVTAADAGNVNEEDDEVSFKPTVPSVAAEPAVAAPAREPVAARGGASAAADDGEVSFKEAPSLAPAPAPARSERRKAGGGVTFKTAPASEPTVTFKTVPAGSAPPGGVATRADNEETAEMARSSRSSRSSRAALPTKAALVSKALAAGQSQNQPAGDLASLRPLVGHRPTSLVVWVDCSPLYWSSCSPAPRCYKWCLRGRSKPPTSSSSVSLSSAVVASTPSRS